MDSTITFRPSDKGPQMPAGLSRITICGLDFTAAEFAAMAEQPARAEPTEAEREREYLDWLSTHPDPLEECDEVDLSDLEPADRVSSSFQDACDRLSERVERMKAAKNDRQEVRSGGQENHEH